MKKTIILMITLLTLILISGCIGFEDDADVVSYNISKNADNFRILRRIIFYNGITDKYIMLIEGFCSIYKDNGDNQLEITCKVGHEQYKKHYFGLSDNSLYFVEQIDSAKVSAFHYRVVFKPQVIIPEIEIRTNSKELFKNKVKITH